MDMELKRTSNFSEKEVAVLVTLVRKYGDKIECRKTDKNTNQIKLKAWMELANEYNSISGEIYRDVKVLRNKYENNKKRTKQKFINEKTYIHGTGGGPSKMTNITNIDYTIKEIIGTQITGLSSQFDTDNQCNSKEKENYPEEEVEEENVEEPASQTTPELQESKKKFGNWKKFTPDMLRTKKSASLRVNLKTNNRENCANQAEKNIAEWASEKTKTVTQDALHKREEHELKMQNMREEHQLRLQLIRDRHARELENLDRVTEEEIRLMREKWCNQL